MRQRFGIAQALIGDPGLIIVDEPTAGLDPEERNRFLNLLAEIGENVVVILSTHIVEDVSDLCPDMAIISGGRIVRQGSPAELVRRLKGCVWRKTIDKADLGAYRDRYDVISTRLFAGRTVDPRPFRHRSRRRLRADRERAGGRLLLDAHGLAPAGRLTERPRRCSPRSRLSSSATTCASRCSGSWRGSSPCSSSAWSRSTRSPSASAPTTTRTAPSRWRTTTASASVFFMFVTTAFVASIVVRDEETGFGPILWSTRVSKFDYLYGRFAGAFAAVALAFLAVPIGAFVGSLMPWIDPEKLGPFQPEAYLFAYFVIALAGAAADQRRLLRARHRHPVDDGDLSRRGRLLRRLHGRQHLGRQARAGAGHGPVRALRRGGLRAGHQVLDHHRARHPDPGAARACCCGTALFVAGAERRLPGAGLRPVPLRRAAGAQDQATRRRPTRPRRRRRPPARAPSSAARPRWRSSGPAPGSTWARCSRAPPSSS